MADKRVKKSKSLPKEIDSRIIDVSGYKIAEKQRITYAKRQFKAHPHKFLDKQKRLNEAGYTA